MKQIELKEAIKNYASKSAGLTWQKSGYVNSAFISKFAVVNRHEFNTAYYSVYTVTSNPKLHYVTLLCFYNDEYILKCGDPYLEGTLTQETLSNLIKTAVRKAAKETNKKFIGLLKAGYKQTPKSQACFFNQKNFTLIDSMCPHIAQFLHDLPEDVPDRLFYKYHDVMSTIDESGVSSDLQIKFERYAFKKHILLEGDKGSGKTYAATSWVRDKNVEQVFVGGHEQFESIDFLGHYIQKKNAELIWKDGALSEAFRKANSGKRTVLILDEILRVPKRELNILISALSPINSHYVLRTGRALNSEGDIAEEEVITAPVENLWVIGTTNVGDDYEVESMDEALIDRFKPIRKETTESEIKNILLQTSKKRNFSLGSVDKLMYFYSKMQRLKQTNIISKLVNIRHLNEALELAKDESEIQVILEDSILLWVERENNGKPNKEQTEAINTLMRKIYG